MYTFGPVGPPCGSLSRKNSSIVRRADGKGVLKYKTSLKARRERRGAGYWRDFV